MNQLNSKTESKIRIAKIIFKKKHIHIIWFSHLEELSWNEARVNHLVHSQQQRQQNILKHRVDIIVAKAAAVEKKDGWSHKLETS